MERNRIALLNDSNNVAFGDLEYRVSAVFQSSDSAKQTVDLLRFSTPFQMCFLLPVSPARGETGEAISRGGLDTYTFYMQKNTKCDITKERKNV